MALAQLFGPLNWSIEILISLITLVVGAYSLNIHRVTLNRKHKLLGVAFILISVSYLVKVGVNIANVYGFVLELSTLSALSMIYSAFLLFGYTVFDKLFLDVKNYRLFSLQILLWLLSLFLIYSQSLWFLDIIGFALLLYPVLYFFENYRKRKSMQSLFVLLAFFGLMISHGSFFLIFLNRSLFFVDNLIRLFSYAILLVNYIVIKK